MISICVLQTHGDDTITSVLHDIKSDTETTAFNNNNLAFDDSEVLDSRNDQSQQSNISCDKEAGLHTNSVIISELPEYDNRSFRVSSDDVTRVTDVNITQNKTDNEKENKHTCCRSLRCLLATVVVIVCVAIAIAVGLGVGLGLGLHGKLDVCL